MFYTNSILNKVMFVASILVAIALILLSIWSYLGKKDINQRFLATQASELSNFQNKYNENNILTVDISGFREDLFKICLNFYDEGTYSYASRSYSRELTGLDFRCEWLYTRLTSTVATPEEKIQSFKDVVTRMDNAVKADYGFFDFVGNDNFYLSMFVAFISLINAEKFYKKMKEEKAEKREKKFKAAVEKAKQKKDNK